MSGGVAAVERLPGKAVCFGERAVLFGHTILRSSQRRRSRRPAGAERRKPPRQPPGAERPPAREPARLSRQIIKRVGQRRDPAHKPASDI